jgi:acetoin utilization protein AcuB
MFVKDYMTRHPIMVGPEMKVTEVQKIMTENKIRHLPIVGDGKRLLGLVTRQRLAISPANLGSLEVWEITRYLSDLTVDKVMLKGDDLHMIDPDATLEEAAEVMINNKIGGMPVVENGIVVGIITETDLLVELQNLLGANEPGWRITMRVPDKRGEFSRLTTAILQKGWGIMAMGSIRSPRDPGYWDIVLKVRGADNEDEIMAALKEIEGQQLIDCCETTVHSH